ncbi:MAG: DUF1573 domain-containing protein, partial [bacterium]|nr:DUF1573 domain-containing protein [bacterium]
MKKLVIFILVMSLLTFSLAAKSSMKFKKTTLDFGELESGKSVDLNFEFVNDGDSILVIKNISTSCGCTAAKLEKTEYQPGEEGVIPVKFNSKGQNGKVIKSITIATNDEDEIYKRLKITGKVKLTNFAAIEMIPDRLDFKKITMGQDYAKEIVIKNTGNLELRILEVSHSPDILPLFPDKVIKPGEKIAVTITLKQKKQLPRKLIQQTYPGMADHKAHFDYLLPTFADDRYIRVEGQPIFTIFRPQDIPD